MSVYLRRSTRLSAIWLAVSLTAFWVGPACGPASKTSDGSGNAGDGSVDASGGGASNTGGSATTGGGPANSGGTGGGSGGEGAAETGGAGGAAGDSALPEFCVGLKTAPEAGDWQSEKVFFEDGQLTYVSDAESNRIVDFSYAGYHYGEAELPQIAEVTRLGPETGDQTARIQAALDAVAARTPDENGIRGALVLDPGTYEIFGTLHINADGVVLRGSGDEEDPGQNTILLAKGDTPHQRTVVILGSGDGSPWDEEEGTRTDIVSDFIPVGSLQIEVADASGYAVGNRVVLTHPATAEWIAAVDGGGLTDDADWDVNTVNINYNRRIIEVNGSTLSLDAPLYDHFDRSLSQAYIYQATRTALVTHVGIENLRVDIETAGGEDENHAWSAVGFVGVEDAWARDLTAMHFGYAGVRTQGALRVTVQDVRALDPVAVRTGSRMYNFSVDAQSQLILFKGCEARGGRHNFVSNGTSSVSGIVVYDSMSDEPSTSSEGHRRWSQAMLFDNVVEHNAPEGERVIGLYNRGDWGTSHGWALTHSVLWNYDVGSGHAVVQKPPTGQNYAIGGVGDFRGNGPWPGPPGFMEQNPGSLLPHSLYLAELCERFAQGRLRSEVVGLPKL